MTKFLTVGQIIELHDTFVEDHGGLVGIRDRGLLASAVERCRAVACSESCSIRPSSTRRLPISFTLSRTIPSTMATIVFPEDEYEDLVVNVAQGKHTKAEIAYFLEHGKLQASAVSQKKTLVHDKT